MPPNISDVPLDLLCRCGEPYKVYREAGTAWIGCQKCNSEIHHDEPKGFEQAAKTLKQFWKANHQSEIIDL